MLSTMIRICSILLWLGCTETAQDKASRVAGFGEAALNLQNREGETDLAERRYERAVSAFEKALAGGREDSVRAYAGLSRSHLGLGDRAQAAAFLQQAASLDSSRPNVAFARAELLLDQYLETRQGPVLDNALAAAQRAVHLDPGRKDYLYTLGNLYNHRGDLDAAEVAYRRSLSLDSELASSYERLGRLYKYQGRSPEAVEAYRKLLELRPADVEAMCELAALHRADGRPGEAIDLLERAARLDTNLAMAYLNLGQLYLASGRQSAAERALQRFRALTDPEDDTAVLLARAEANPRHANAFLRLADAFSRQGERARAEPHYLKAIQLDSSLAAAYTGLGKVYLQQQEFDLAAQTLERAAAIDPAPHIYDLLATTYRQSGEHEQERQARHKARTAAGD